MTTPNTNYFILFIAGESQVKPVSVFQSSTFEYEGYREEAEYAIDGSLATSSHTDCAWVTDIWYKMTFDAIYCFSKVVIVQSKTNEMADRMDGTDVFVVNTETGAKSLCGVLKVGSGTTIESQTYTIPCDQKCGNEVKLTLRHDKPKYNMEACIHMKEITAFYTGLKIRSDYFCRISLVLYRISCKIVIKLCDVKYLYMRRLKIK